jgi:hypothetical protein
MHSCALQEAAAEHDGDGREPIDAAEIFEHIRDITDPEHPYSLEQLNVVEEELINVDDPAGYVRYAVPAAAGFLLLLCSSCCSCGSSCFPDAVYAWSVLLWHSVHSSASMGLCEQKHPRIMCGLVAGSCSPLLWSTAAWQP